MGVRHVRDADYWGMPVGTPITPGMRARVKMAKGRAATRLTKPKPAASPEPTRGRAAKAMRPPTARTLRTASDEQLADMFAEISTRDTPDEAALTRVLAEMERREQPSQHADVTPEQAQADAQLDRLVAQGWEFRDAYAEVHGLSDDELRRQELNAALDINRRTGETREKTVRRLYAEWVHLQYLSAERAVRGHLLTSDAQARGVDPVALFSGPAARARKWASEDLKRWWADNGRVTYTEFRADMLGRASDKAKAEQIRKRANDRDFGL